MEASTTTQERTLTEMDHVRLRHLIDRDTRDGSSSSEFLDIESILDAAELVPSRSVSHDVVTMHSQVLMLDLGTGNRQTLTVCYPSEAQPAAGFVSVFSPVGASLLGLRVGAVARWRTPGGADKAAEIVALLFQPEATGDYTT